MKRSIYRTIRGVLKYTYFSLKKILPSSVFMYLGLNAMYYINRLTVKSKKFKYGFKLLGELPISFKKSDTLFILGSGSSINSFTREQWELIEKNDSIGFNFWLIHDFVPNFYVYEENSNERRNNIFYQNLNNKKNDYKNVPIIVKDIEYKGVSGEQIPDQLIDNIYLSTDITVGCTAEELDLFFRTGHKYISMKNRDRINALLKKSGSLSYLIMMAEQMDYENIVLCGIDLNNSNYFYDNPQYENKLLPHNYDNKTQTHPTNQSNKGNIPIEEVIFSINENILAPQGKKLYIGSKESVLYPKLPYFFKSQEAEAN